MSAAAFADQSQTYYILACESPLNSDEDRESVLSVQAKETDFVRDTSDTSYDYEDEEYEPATETEEEQLPVNCVSDNSGDTDNEIICTKVISVAVLDDGDLEFADSEDSNKSETDPEMDLTDYWQCAQCRNPNNDPRYRYCEKCFKVRKNFFPPRPKRKSNKQRRDQFNEDLNSALEKSSGGFKGSGVDKSLERHTGLGGCTVSDVHTDPGVQMVASIHTDPGVHTDSGVDSAFSQELSQSQEIPSPLSTASFEAVQVPAAHTFGLPAAAEDSLTNTVNEMKENASNTSVKINSNIVILGNRLKRKAESVEWETKRCRQEYSESDSSQSDSDMVTKIQNNLTQIKASHVKVSPLTKMQSDPLVTFQSLESVNENRKVVSEAESMCDRSSKHISKIDSENDNLCIVCCTEPKSGVFVHKRVAHICCCYGCAVKVWVKAKRCPVCNCKINNVLRAVVM